VAQQAAAVVDRKVNVSAPLSFGRSQAKQQSDALRDDDVLLLLTSAGRRDEEIARSSRSC
jgi:hypothetical protein